MHTCNLSGGVPFQVTLARFVRPASDAESAGEPLPEGEGNAESSPKDRAVGGWQEAAGIEESIYSIVKHPVTIHSGICNTLYVYIRIYKCIYIHIYIYIYVFIWKEEDPQMDCFC